MTHQLLDLDPDPAKHRSHPLHTGERIWTETNCYVDLWIEVLHALGLDPVAGLAFTLSADFEGDQWTFFKYPAEDLRRLYGLQVNELNVWRPVVEHVAEQLQLGHLLSVDVDAWYLPDTAGVSYRREHQKTSIMPRLLDTEGRRLGYFHGSGYFELEADDFDGIFRLGPYYDPAALPPYVEAVRLDALSARRGEELRAVAVELAGEHLARRPAANPVLGLKKRLQSDLGWLAAGDVDDFHRYAFGTCRQCGACAELAGSFVDWLDEHDGGGLAGAAEQLRAVASGAKSVQFALTRVLRGKTPDLDGPLDAMAAAYDEALAALVDRYGR